MWRSRCFVLATIITTGYCAFYISNLTPSCMRCLCVAASKCNVTQGCYEGFCGPFQISEEYWKDAGRPTLFGDSANRTGAFLDCAQDYTCSKSVVENYIINFGTDCNGDGVTNCDDYAMLHYNLRRRCHEPMTETNFGKRFSNCKSTSIHGSESVT